MGCSEVELVLSYRRADTKVGLSIFTVMGLCSLGDELPDFGDCDASAASDPARNGLTANEKVLSARSIIRRTRKSNPTRHKDFQSSCRTETM